MSTLYVTPNSSLWEEYARRQLVEEYGQLTDEEVWELTQRIALDAPEIPEGYTVTRLPNRQHRRRQTI